MIETTFISFLQELTAYSILVGWLRDDLYVYCNEHTRTHSKLLYPEYINITIPECLIQKWIRSNSKNEGEKNKIRNVQHC